jgi:hypothetical protein
MLSKQLCCIVQGAMTRKKSVYVQSICSFSPEYFPSVGGWIHGWGRWVDDCPAWASVLLGFTEERLLYSLWLLCLCFLWHPEAIQCYGHLGSGN